MKSLKKVLRYIKPYKLFAILSVLSNIFSVIFHLLSLLVLIPFLQLLFGKTEPVSEKPEFSWTSDYVSDTINYQMTPHIEANGLMGALYYLCIAVAVLFFAKNLFRYLAKFFLAYIRSGVVRDIRSDIYAKILVLPLSFYSEEKKGDIISRITGDVQEVEWSIMNSLEMLFRDPISIILSLVFMVSISPELTVFSFILLPISGLIIGRIGKSLKRTSAKLQIRMGELLSNVEETLTGLRIIKAFNAEKEANNRFGGQNEIYRNTMLSMFRKRDLASPMSEFLGSLVMVTLLWFGGSMVVDPAMNFDGEDFIAYITMFSQLLNPAKSLSTAYYNIQKGAASTERIDAVLEADNKIFDKENARSKNTFDKELKYENLSFAYGKEEVLSSINLSVLKGKMVALVGPSGEG